MRHGEKKGRHPVHSLTDLRIRRLKDAGRFADGNGLYLVVTKTGSKQWVLRATVNGRRKDIGLGGYPSVSLAQAREETLQLKNLINVGVDPVKYRREKKRITPSFAEAAYQVHRENIPTWKNSKQADQWINSLKSYAFPKIGSLRVDDISVDDVLSVLNPIWVVKAETANRVRQRMLKIFKWCKRKGYMKENPAEDIQEALPKVRRKREHFVAMSYDDIAAFIARLQSSSQTPNVRLGLEFLILTACRSGELRGALWEEIDFKNRLWIIPDERMKANREHTVPLTERALEIIKEIRPISGKSELLFPSSQNWRKVMSDATLSAAVKRMGYKVTVHGFRSTFRDWASETRTYPNDVVEMALAHSNRNKTEAAYKRGKLLEKRRELMDDWDNHIHR
ncbi:MAG: integrase arm-type DNA-binding domain-containing protein [Litorimonas sp.]